MKPYSHKYHFGQLYIFYKKNMVSALQTCSFTSWKPLIGCYTQKYGVNNAWRYDLSDGGRMVYAIVPESNGLVVYILEGFKTHVEYEKRFGY